MTDKKQETRATVEELFNKNRDWAESILREDADFPAPVASAVAAVSVDRLCR